MRASIIIPVFNEEFLTRLCLASLQLAELPDAEIIMVDNGSTDETPRLLEEWADGETRRFLRSEKNLNFGPGCNWGASEARGELLVFLNNDTFVFRNWLLALLRPFSDLAVQITGSRLLFPNGRIQHAGVAFDVHGPHHVFVGAPGDFPPALDQRDCQAVTGASLAARRQLFDELGGFDLAFRNSGEDIDLCLRAKAKGGRVIYVPSSVAYHFESMTPGRSHHERSNRQLLLDRWRDRWEEDLLPLVAAAEAAGYDINDRRFPVAKLKNRFKEPPIDELQEREREVNEMWTRFREQEPKVRHLHELEREVERLRPLVGDVETLKSERDELALRLGLRSVQTVLRGQKVFRRLFPPRNREALEKDGA